MIRQYPNQLSGVGSGSIQIDPADFTLDASDVGVDYGSAFSGLISTVDFDSSIKVSKMKLA